MSFYYTSYNSLNNNSYIRISNFISFCSLKSSKKKKLLQFINYVCPIIYDFILFVWTVRKINSFLILSNNSSGYIFYKWRSILNRIYIRKKSITFFLLKKGLLFFNFFSKKESTRIYIYIKKLIYNRYMYRYKGPYGLPFLRNNRFFSKFSYRSRINKNNNKKKTYFIKNRYIKRSRKYSSTSIIDIKKNYLFRLKHYNKIINYKYNLNNNINNKFRRKKIYKTISDRWSTKNKLFRTYRNFFKKTHWSNLKNKISSRKKIRLSSFFFKRLILRLLYKKIFFIKNIKKTGLLNRYYSYKETKALRWSKKKKTVPVFFFFSNFFSGFYLNIELDLLLKLNYNMSLNFFNFLFNRIKKNYLFSLTNLDSIFFLLKDSFFYFFSNNLLFSHFFIKNYSIYINGYNIKKNSFYELKLNNLINPFTFFRIKIVNGLNFFENFYILFFNFLFSLNNNFYLKKKKVIKNDLLKLLYSTFNYQLIRRTILSSRLSFQRRIIIKRRRQSIKDKKINLSFLFDRVYKNSNFFFLYKIYNFYLISYLTFFSKSNIIKKETNYLLNNLNIYYFFLFKNLKNSFFFFKNIKYNRSNLFIIK